ncbi:MAG: hypothetical protein ACRENE_20900 [Polyangiaceae bacterium]
MRSSLWYRRLPILVATALSSMWACDALANNPTLHACGPQAAVTVAPQKVVVIYWDTKSDPNQEAYFDLQMVNMPNDSSLVGGSSLVGTPYLEDVTEYYYEYGPALQCQDHTVFLSNSVGSTPDSWAVAPGPPNPTCAQENAVVDAVAQNYPPNTYTSQRTMFVLQLAPGQAQGCFQGGCAYHNHTPNDNAYVLMPYKTQGYQGCGAPTLYDALATVLLHEIAELETDWDGDTGWWNTNRYEIADNPCSPLPDGTYPERQLFPSIGSVGQSRVGLQPLWSRGANGGDGACVYSMSAGSANFYVGSDGQIWVQQNLTNYASAWGKPYGYASGVRFRSAPAVATWGPYRFDLYGYDTNAHLNHVFQLTGGGMRSDDWGTPPGFPLAGYMGKPEVTSWGFGRVDVFASITSIGGTGMLHRSWDSWIDSGWASLPSFPVTVASSPAAASWGPGEVDVFALGTDGNIYQSTSTDGTTFAAWQTYVVPLSIPQATGDPDAASWGSGRLDVFVASKGGKSLTHLWEDATIYPYSGFDTWSVPSGYTLTGSPTATALGDQRLKVVATTTAGNFVEWYYDFGATQVSVLGTQFNPAFGSSTVTTLTNNQLHP